MEVGCKSIQKNLMKKSSYHMTVYAKNKDGLKELFELITLSHTQYLVSMGKENGQPVLLRKKFQRNGIMETY